MLKYERVPNILGSEVFKCALCALLKRFAERKPEHAQQAICSFVHRALTTPKLDIPEGEVTQDKVNTLCDSIIGFTPEAPTDTQLRYLKYISSILMLNVLECKLDRAEKK